MNKQLQKRLRILERSNAKQCPNGWTLFWVAQYKFLRSVLPIYYQQQSNYHLKLLPNLALNLVQIHSVFYIFYSEWHLNVLSMPSCVQIVPIWSIFEINGSQDFPIWSQVTFHVILSFFQFSPWLNWNAPNLA